MHWYEKWLDTFKTNPAFDDAPWVRIQRETGVRFECIGVHHLAPDENRGNHHVYLCVIGEDGSRVNGARIEWGWDGMHGDEHTTPVALDKPPSEPWGNIPLGAGQVAWVKVFGAGSDTVSNLTTAPEMDDVDGNTRFHHSYFVAFRHTAGGPVTPPPVEPPGEPGEPFDVGPALDLMVRSAHAHQDANNLLIEAVQKLRDLMAAHQG